MVRGEQFTPLLIRAIRLLCKLSQRDAGELFGTGEKSFEKYESGQIRPSEPTKRLLRLAMTNPKMFGTRKRKAIEVPVEKDSKLVRHTIQKARLDRFYAPLFRGNRSRTG
jgi:transcriptional regulator with XRE-family HTH domain